MFVMEMECVYHEVLCVSSGHCCNRFRGVVVRPVDIYCTWCSIAEYSKMCYISLQHVLLTHISHTAAILYDRPACSAESLKWR